ncbi:MAG: hypothetical protein Kow0027_15480 [Saprospiraceae bacterium]
MKNLNEKADVVEQVLPYLIQQTKEVENPPSEYAMYIDPVISDTWLLVVYFETIEKLRKALKSGLCYNIHKFLQQVLAEQEILKEEVFDIVFDHGKRPDTEEKALSYFGKLYRKLEKMREDTAHASNTCAQCGHPKDQHSLLGFPNENSTNIEEGWMICPEEDCTCFHTWSVNRDWLQER